MSRLTTRGFIAATAVGFLAIAISLVNAQAPGGSGRGARGGGGGGGRGIGAPVFAAVDTNNDGSVKRDEMKAAFEAWFKESDKTKAGSITQANLLATITPVINVADPQSVSAMMAAMPTAPAAKPAHARKILVYGYSAGFIHSSIPLAAKMVEAMGNQNKLWTTTVTYDPRDITAKNLKQYDLVFLDSTTGCFLDDPQDKVVSEQRRKDLMDFIRSGKGIAGIHAASDSYHTDCSKPGSPSGSANPVTVAALIMTQGDANGDKKLSREEMVALADKWFDKMDPSKTGALSQADFVARFNADLNPPAGGPAGGGGGAGFGGGRGFSGGGGRGASGRGGGGGAGFGRGGDAAAPWVPLGQTPRGTVLEWPEWNKLIGGFFKFHWSNLHATVKIDDPKSPLTAMFHGQEFEITDETYTYAQDSFSRKNVHMLTSLDYTKMSDAEKRQEAAADARTDGDYALSYIRPEGKGRMFYEAHGHADSVYAMTPMLEHVRAGIQYALGDLKADDSPSVK